MQILIPPTEGIGPGWAWGAGKWFGLLLLVTAVCEVAAEPLAKWTFDAERTDGTKMVDRAGNLDGSILGPVRLGKDPFGHLNPDGEANNVDVPNIELDEFPTTGTTELTGE